jgi:hypothetical protein
MVDAFVLGNKERSIYSYNSEGDLLISLPTYLSLQKQLGIDTPVFVLLSLLGVEGLKIVTKLKSGMVDTTDGIYPNDLVIPEAIIDGFDDVMAPKMKPIFDAIWNAAGRAGSANYDDNGEWHGVP